MIAKDAILQRSQRLQKLGIVGLGNPLCGDDGAGVAVVRRLHQQGWPGWMLEAGSDLLAIQSHQPYPETLLLIDACRNHPVGGLHLFAEKRIAITWGSHAHGLGAGERLALLLQVDPAFAHTNRWWIGIGAGVTEYSSTLSPAVEEAVEALTGWLIGALPRPFMDRDPDVLPPWW